MEPPNAGDDPARNVHSVAEDTGPIIPIGEWVLRQACNEAAKWPDEIKVAVNLFTG